jgi:formiminoglutamase
MEISHFFTPSSWHLKSEDNVPSWSLFHQTAFYTESFDWNQETVKLALIGVKETRNSPDSIGCVNTPDVFRDFFYNLTKWDEPSFILDMGDIHQGHEVSDTLFALKSSIEFLLKKGIIPIVIGGSQDLTYANYQAYENLEQTVNLVAIDPKLDFATEHNDQSANGYLNKIVLHKPNYLFNFSNLGHQRYLTDPEILNLMEKMYFDSTRLGELQTDLRLAEPVIRNADVITIDFSSIRSAESPGSTLSSPNGFYGNEMAQLSRYAGMSDKLTSIGFYECNTQKDWRDTSSKLLAQCVWCFVEGFIYRKGDFPKGGYDSYIRYSVLMDDSGDELVFYKSPLSDRWWMDVPYPDAKKKEYERHHLVPCSYEDYETALKQEMPDRWWRTFQKLV